MQMFSPFFKEQLFSTSWDLNVAGFTSVSFFKRKYTLEKITSVSNIKFDVTEKHEKRSLFVIKFRAQKSWGECAFAVLFWRWKTKLVSNYFFQWLVKSFHSLYISSFCSKMWKNCFCCREKELSSRTIWVGREQSSTQKFPPNVIRNQKYSLFSFIPMVRIFKIKLYLANECCNLTNFSS